MKIILFTFVVCALGMSHANMMKEVMEVRKQCKTDLGIEKPKFEKGKKPVMDPKMKCLDKCVVEKLDVINAKGELNTNKLPADMKDMATKCFEDVKALEACDRAHKFSKCVFEAMQQGVKVWSDDCAKETKTEIKFEKPEGGKRHGKDRVMKLLKDDTKACYNRCMMIKMKKMDENNEFIVDSLSMYARDGVDVAAIAETCTKDNNQENNCSKAAKRGLCFAENVFKKGPKGKE